MKIGLYARGLSEQSGGVKEYIRSLATAMGRLAEEKHFQFYLFHGLKELFYAKSSNWVTEIRLKARSKLFSDFIEGPFRINNCGLDAVIFPKNVIPFFVRPKKIQIIHDMGYFLSGFLLYKFLDTLYMRAMIRSSCKRAQAIIADSIFTMEETIRLLKIPPYKIYPIHLAANPCYKIITDKIVLDSIKAKYKLPSKFIFYAGGISPRKNLLTLIAAFNRLCDYPDLKLVLTGNNGWNNRKEYNMIKTNNNIRVLGCLPEDDLAAVYNLAALSVYPSLYEGFGLPILEAQACGCPVIAAKTSSIPEVAGDGADYFEANDIGALSEKINACLGNSRYRRQLIEKGLINVGRFDWPTTAYEYMEIINRISLC